LTLHPSKGDGDTVQLPNRIVEGGVLCFEGMFGIGQSDAVFVDLPPYPVVSGMGDFDAGVKATEEAPAAWVRLGNQNLMSTHRQIP